MGETEFIGILLDSFFSAEIKIGTRVSHAFFQEHPFFLVRLLSKFNYNYDEMWTHKRSFTAVFILLCQIPKIDWNIQNLFTN